ncbi:hypothetical protein [Paenibacillus rubinfantis]|uniref:hypothetical protein n=1 Tax=Paenibacillus rubinfantis TaxID=1720296 RepID=UPI000B260E3A|nr:hypothetical protein [Paenibacillus rubinfantis]
MKKTFWSVIGLMLLIVIATHSETAISALSSKVVSGALSWFLDSILELYAHGELDA